MAARKYNETVRRLFAILLLSAIQFVLVAPAFSVDADTQLPPCCRAHGKHKCAMKRALLPNSITVSPIATLGEKCPFSAASGDTARAWQSVLFGPSQAFFGSVLSYAAMLAQTEAHFRVSFSRTRQKRGPPSLLS